MKKENAQEEPIKYSTQPLPGSISVIPKKRYKINCKRLSVGVRRVAGTAMCDELSRNKRKSVFLLMFCIPRPITIKYSSSATVVVTDSSSHRMQRSIVDRLIVETYKSPWTTFKRLEIINTGRHKFHPRSEENRHPNQDRNWRKAKGISSCQELTHYNTDDLPSSNSSSAGSLANPPMTSPDF